MATRTRAAVILLVLTTCANDARTDPIRLQFRPEIGKKQTVRVTTRAATTTVEVMP